MNDSNEFNKKLRSLKKYCPQAYKHFIFKINHAINFKMEDGDYVLELPTSDEFRFVYGQIKLKYSVINKIPIFKDLEPSQFFLDGYRFDLDVYKSFYCRDEKDKFKINLMVALKGASK